MKTILDTAISTTLIVLTVAMIIIAAAFAVNLW